jgi:hypothetical protein
MQVTAGGKSTYNFLQVLAEYSIVNLDGGGGNNFGHDGKLRDCREVCGSKGEVEIVFWGINGTRLRYVL